MTTKTTTQKINTYKTYERKNNNVVQQRKTEVQVDCLLKLKNQSQLIDAVKHTMIDKSLKTSVNADKIAQAVTDAIWSDERLLTSFFNHEKYLKPNAIVNRVKDHLRCDSRHSEVRFDKRNAQIIAT